MTPADELLIRSVPDALACTERVCSSVNVGSTRDGIDMDAIALMGRIVKRTAEATVDADSLGCAKLVVFCNAPDDNPFMAGAFHGVTEGDLAKLGQVSDRHAGHAVFSGGGKSFLDQLFISAGTAFLCVEQHADAVVDLHRTVL